MSLVVWLSDAGTQPEGNWYDSFTSCETGGVSPAGSFAPRLAALTAATTAARGGLWAARPATNRFGIAGVAIAALAPSTRTILALIVETVNIVTPITAAM